jgi:hypothetical protein
MSTSNQITEIVDDYMRHAHADYVGLWQIASRVREDLRLSDSKEVRQQALIVVRQLVQRGLRPGDYLNTGFDVWVEKDPDAIISRIKKEWNAGDGDPTLADPICWFAAK